jgi:hypothetical protein
MTRVLLTFGLAISLVQATYAQPGGGPGTGSVSPCVVFDLQDCLDISDTGGRCVDHAPHGSHACVYDLQTQVWACEPENGVDMADSTPYVLAIPAPNWVQGWSDYVNVESEPCGFMETCKCDTTDFLCFDDTRVPWGPGDDLPDPAVHGFPPVKNCWGGLIIP